MGKQGIVNKQWSLTLFVTSSSRHIVKAVKKWNFESWSPTIARTIDLLLYKTVDAEVMIFYKHYKS